MRDDLLLEIGTEELPSSYIEPALCQMGEISGRLFKEARIPFKEIKTYGTPRRLVLLVKELEGKQEDSTVEVMGPAKTVAFDKEGNPTEAVKGFARNQKVSIDDLIVKKTEKGEYVFAIRKHAGRYTAKVLPEILKKIVEGISFPKSMRWPQGSIRFARPIRWIVALYGTKCVNFSLGKIKAGRLTRGHPSLCAKPIIVRSVAKYEEILRNNYVIVNQEERKKAIERAIANGVKKIKARVVEDKDLLNEVTYLLEYPTAIVGSFEDIYLRLPADVLVTCLKHHLKFFSCVDSQGRLLPYFVGLRDGISEYMENVRRGYEKVLRARLKDAQFFFEQDSRVSLERNVEKLKAVVFQEELGTIYDKTQRVVKLARRIAEITHTDYRPQILERIALLSKADSVTEMVGEFPELQGIMGREYAKIWGEDEAVAEGIYEHHLPLSMGGALPHLIESAIVSIADKIDTIVGDFLIGLIPTGSEDPYGLRRQAQGIIRIILDKKFAISLDDLVGASLELICECPTLNRSRREAIATVKGQILSFFRQRLEAFLTEQGMGYDEIEAVLSVGYYDLVDVQMRLDSIRSLRDSGQFNAIILGFKRAKNILRQAEERGIRVDLEKFTVEALREPEERKLHDELEKIKAQTETLFLRKQYHGALERLVSLREWIDGFFERVMVMTEDVHLRNNRLALLQRIVSLFCRIADFSKIVERKDND